MASPALIVTVSIAILGIIIALIGIIFRAINIRIDGKVGMDKYMEAMTHINKALDAINGTAATIKRIENTVNKLETKIEDKYLTIREHELTCAALRRPDGS